MEAQRRIEILEAALAEYISMYGLTEQARAAMIRTEPPTMEPDAAPLDVRGFRASGDK